MQVIEKFRTKDDIKAQIENYLDDNSGSTVVTMVRVNEEGDEAVVVVFNDGQ